MTAQDKESAAVAPVLAIACGGTGGHFYPGVTIAREFERQGGRVVLFIGGHHAEEQLATAATLGFAAAAAPAVRLPRGLLNLVCFPFRLLGCIRRCRSLLRAHRVDLALGMGSYASVPLGLGAVFSGIPLALHEGNSGMGQANRWLSRWARVLGLSFPLHPPVPTRARQVLVGMPIRDAIIAAADADAAAVRAELCAELDLDPGKSIVFVFGGSQGAPPITAAVHGLLPLLTDRQKADLQFIHFTGQEDPAATEQAYRDAGVGGVVKPRDPEIHRYYLAADHIICRAGASTIAELAVLGKAPLMIPYPGAKEDHQTTNAKGVLAVEGGWLIPQAELTAERLRAQVDQWLTRPEDRGRNIRRIARPQAAGEMVKELLGILETASPRREVR